MALWHMKRNISIIISLQNSFFYKSNQLLQKQHTYDIIVQGVLSFYWKKSYNNCVLIDLVYYLWKTVDLVKR